MPWFLINRLARLSRLARRFAAARRAAAAVEFAISGLGLFAFLMAIINLGDLGLVLGALQHGVQGAARQAAVQAAANLSGNNGVTTTCPTATDVQSYFNGFASPPLTIANATVSSANGTLASGNSPWTNNGTGTPPGTYLVLTGKYTWKPIGFAYILPGPGLTLSLTTVSFVMGSSTTVTC